MKTVMRACSQLAALFLYATSQTNFSGQKKMEESGDDWPAKCIVRTTNKNKVITRAYPFL